MCARYVEYYYINYINLFNTYMCIACACTYIYNILTPTEMHVHACEHIYTHVNVHTCKYAYIHSQPHACTHTHTHKYTCAPKYPHARTHAHAHTQDTQDATQHVIFKGIVFSNFLKSITPMEIKLFAITMHVNPRC